MPKFIIKGGSPLSGQIAVSGAKNAALKIIPAAILFANDLEIHNLPRIEDVSRAIELLRDLGASVEDTGEKSIRISTQGITKKRLEKTIADKFRSSIMFVGPMLARFREVEFPHPGGCVIGAGSRPIDLALEGFKAFGATIEHSDSYYHLKADKLHPIDYFFTSVSVTTTESFLMTAALIPGRTVLRNCAMEPEIEALAQFLNASGAKITGAGTPTMIIEGTDVLKAKSPFTVIPDRIETGSFAMLSAASRSDITITDCIPGHIGNLLAIFDKIGVPYETGANYLRVKPASTIAAYSIKTHEYPGFSTDLQSPYVVLMTQAKGTSIIHETIYDRRLIWTDMLSQMGAEIVMCDPHRIIVQGPSQLVAKKLMSPDLRAGIALVIAGLIADGATEIDNIYQIDRGYERLEERLRGLGADIERIQ